VQEIKIRQHYVPQYYLKAWEVSGQLYCLRKGNIFQASTRQVAVERYFYEVQDLTTEDVSFIEIVINTSCHEHLRRLNKNFLTLLSALKGNVHIDPSDPRHDELRLAVDTALINLEENYHCGVEKLLFKTLDSMLQGDTSFFSNDGECVQFLYCLSTQYMRTKKIREAVLARASVPVQGADLRRSWNILSHVFATNLGCSLFEERAKLRLVLIDNNTPEPFIAGDQPVVNIHPSSGGMAAEQVELYYPLGPQMAMLLIEKSTPAPTQVTLEDVRNYNKLIATNSHEQLFSNSKFYLESVKKWTVPD
jgi:hypothetical protein